MTRLSLRALLGSALLAGCAGTTSAPLALLSAESDRCIPAREAARIEAGFRLQAAATGYAGSADAALAQDMEDARLANDIASAAFVECMAGR